MMNTMKTIFGSTMKIFRIARSSMKIPKKDSMIVKILDWMVKDSLMKVKFKESKNFYEIKLKCQKRLDKTWIEKIVRQLPVSNKFSTIIEPTVRCLLQQEFCFNVYFRSFDATLVQWKKSKRPTFHPQVTDVCIQRQQKSQLHSLSQQNSIPNSSRH